MARPLSSKTQSGRSSQPSTTRRSCSRGRRVSSAHSGRCVLESHASLLFAAPCTFVKLQPRAGMWQSARLIEIDLGVLKYGRMQLKDLPRFDGVVLCYDSLVPASYEALPNLMRASSSTSTSSPPPPLHFPYGRAVVSTLSTLFASICSYRPHSSLLVGFHRLGTPFIVVGCRADLPQQVSPEAVADDCSHLEAGLVLTTTATQDGVKKMQGAFSWIVKAVLRRRDVVSTV